MTIKNRRFNLLLTVLLAIPLASFLALPEKVTSGKPALASHVSDQALIKLRGSDKIYALDTAGEDLQNFINENEKNKSIELIEPNYTYTTTIEPSDPYYTQQIYLSQISAPQAWDVSTGNNSTIIAVLDTGVDIDHPDLRNNIWYNLDEIPNNFIDDDANGYTDDVRGWDFVSSVGDPRPKFENSFTFLGINHGTIVSGVVAAEGNNNQGVTGVTWQNKIMPLRVLASDGTGSTLDVASAIDYARENGASIINLSFVGDGNSKILETAIYRAHQAGILIIAAAGNEVEKGIDLGSEPRYPVCHDGPFGSNWVIGVASVDNYDRLASFSNYGKCIDIITPGLGIFSTLVKNDSFPKYNRLYGGHWSGTSVSAPQVAGVVALIKSLKPLLTLAEIKSLLLDNTDNIDQQNTLYVGKLGRGKLNASKVIHATFNSVSRAENRIDKVVVGPASNGGPQIQTYQDAKLFSQFFAFDKKKNYGTNVSSYDLDGDGQEEIIAAANEGEEPWVKIFNARGDLQLGFYAFPKSMKSGLEVEAGDLNNDGVKEIIVTATKNHEPLVKIFSMDGKLVDEFYAFNKFYKGGLDLAVGDVNNDGFDEIVVATGPGTSPFIKIFNYQKELTSEFIAYDPGFMRGITIAVGDLNGDGQDEIITGTRSGGGPQVRIFDWTGRVQSQFFAYNEKFTGGVNVAAGDIDGNGQDEIITGAGPGGGPHVRVFNYKGDVVWQFFAYDSNFTGGVKVASGK
jgi:subtilisin family serine protease